jgi:hypothetical protein
MDRSALSQCFSSSGFGISSSTSHSAASYSQSQDRMLWKGFRLLKDVLSRAMDNAGDGKSYLQELGGLGNRGPNGGTDRARAQGDFVSVRQARASASERNVLRIVLRSRGE